MPEKDRLTVREETFVLPGLDMLRQACPASALVLEALVQRVLTDHYRPPTISQLLQTTNRIRQAASLPPLSPASQKAIHASLRRLARRGFVYRHGQSGGQGGARHYRTWWPACISANLYWRNNAKPTYRRG